MLALSLFSFVPQVSADSVCRTAAGSTVCVSEDAYDDAQCTQSGPDGYHCYDTRHRSEGASYHDEDRSFGYNSWSHSHASESGDSWDCGDGSESTYRYAGESTSEGTIVYLYDESTGVYLTAGETAGTGRNEDAGTDCSGDEWSSGFGSTYESTGVYGSAAGHNVQAYAHESEYRSEYDGHEDCWSNSGVTVGVVDPEGTSRSLSYLTGGSCPDS